MILLLSGLHQTSGIKNDKQVNATKASSAIKLMENAQIKNI